jgi:hypothetical protein
MTTDLDERPVHHALDPYSDTGSIKSLRGKKRDGNSDSGQGPESTTAGPQAGPGCRKKPQAGSVRADPAGADPAGADPAGADPAGADPAGLTRPSKPLLEWGRGIGVLAV